MVVLSYDVTLATIWCKNNRAKTILQSNDVKLVILVILKEWFQITNVKRESDATSVPSLRNGCKVPRLWSQTGICAVVWVLKLPL